MKGVGKERLVVFIWVVVTASVRSQGRAGQVQPIRILRR